MSGISPSTGLPFFLFVKATWSAFSGAVVCVSWRRLYWVIRGSVGGSKLRRFNSTNFGPLLFLILFVRAVVSQGRRTAFVHWGYIGTFSLRYACSLLIYRMSAFFVRCTGWISKIYVWSLGQCRGAPLTTAWGVRGKFLGGLIFDECVTVRRANHGEKNREVYKVWRGSQSKCLWRWWGMRSRSVM